MCLDQSGIYIYIYIYISRGPMGLKSISHAELHGIIQYDPTRNDDHCEDDQLILKII